MENRRTNFWICYIAYTAFTLDFAIRGAIGPDLIASFHITDTQLGHIFGNAFWGFAFGAIVSGWLVQLIAMRTLFLFTASIQIISILSLLFIPENLNPETFHYLFTSAIVLMGISEGFIFGIIHPLLSILYMDETAGKTRILNYLHTNWPLFIVIGALVAEVFSLLHLPWRDLVACLLIAPIIYGWMSRNRTFPIFSSTQTPHSNHKEMIRETYRPGFLLLLLCFIMTAVIELAPQEWITTLMQQKLGINGLIFLIFASFIQLLFRLIGGRLTHFVAPPTLLTCATIFSIIGLYIFSITETVTVGLLGALLFGIGVAWYWPTLLAITADQYPRGKGLVLGIMNAVGFISLAIFTPYLGYIADIHGPSSVFRFVAYLGVIVFLILLGISIYFRVRGGYRRVEP